MSLVSGLISEKKVHTLALISSIDIYYRFNCFNQKYQFNMTIGFYEKKESLLVLWSPVQVFDLCVIFDDLTRTILEEVERPTVLLPGEAC